MKIDDISKILTLDKFDYELRVSCMTYEYTLENPESSHCVSIYKEDDYSICVDINWSEKSKTLIKMLFEYNTDLDIISWDTDDGNMIEFKHIIICNHKKLIILVS